MPTGDPCGSRRVGKPRPAPLPLECPAPQDLPPEIMADLIRHARPHLGGRATPVRIAPFVRDALEKANVQPPGIGATLLFLARYGLSLLAVLAAAAVLLAPPLS